MKKAILLIVAVLLSVAGSYAQHTISQGWYLSSLAGTKSGHLHVACEIDKAITKHYSVGVDAGYSNDQSEFCIIQRVTANKVLGVTPVILAEFGLGHSYLGEDCNDHNWHVYRVGMELYRPIRSNELFIRAEHCGRSFQGHIGWHRPNARLSLGMRIRLSKL